MGTATGTSNVTRHFEDGQEVFPCRCGDTHRGDYAAYDYAHHNCFHSEPLVAIEVDDGSYMCPQCGEVFWLAHRERLGL